MRVSTPVEFTWDAEDEIQLFYALDGMRPFGHNKHFVMALLVDRLSSKLNKDITSSILWAKLKTMYCLSALDEIEPKPAVFEDETDFTLPESYLNKVTVDTIEDIAGDEDSEVKSEKSEPASTVLLQVVKEELSRTRNSTPARQLQETSSTSETKDGGSSAVKRTQPKRTRASTSTVETPSPTPGTKRRR